MTIFDAKFLANKKMILFSSQQKKELDTQKDDYELLMEQTSNSMDQK